MNDSQGIFDNYEFIIVDDSRDKIDKIREELTSLNVLPRIITEDDYTTKAFRAVKDTYEKDKLPFLFLDEHLDIDTSEYGSNIAELVIEFFGEKGGVIIPTSESLEHQLWKMKFLVKDTKEWHIEKDPSLISGFLAENVNEVCKEYLEGREKKESDIKNG